MKIKVSSAVACSALLTAVTFSLVSPLPAGHAETAPLASRFTMAVFPDTQYESAGSFPAGDHFMTKYGSEPYKVQTAWLAKNKKAFGLKFAVHLGDVVDNSIQEGQWKAADVAMRTLEQAGIPYSVAPGNHDMGPIPVVGGSANKIAEEAGYYANDGAQKIHFPREIEVKTNPSLLDGKMPQNYPLFSTWFSVDRARRNPTFRERFVELNNESEYHIFTAEGHSFLVLALAYQASDRVLQWAQKVIDQHPNLPVILTTHEILKPEGNQVRLTGTYGQHLWDDFIRKNDQIFLTLSGHNAGSGTIVTRNDKGHAVIHILQDYQEYYDGGSGLLGLLQFDFTHNTIEMLAASPFVAAKKPSLLTSKDVLYYNNPQDSFVKHLNFAQRFAGFTRFAADPREANDLDYLGIARESLHRQQPSMKPTVTPFKAEKSAYFEVATYYFPVSIPPVKKQ